jgi:hypothetical protein
MAGAIRYLLNRNGRFFAPLVVPKDLRQIVGKSGLRTALGPDLRTAMNNLRRSASLQHGLAQAEQRDRDADGPSYPFHEAA